MRHRVKKTKLRYGRDADKMLLRKLIKALIKEKKITTTLAKAKLLRSFADRILSRSKEDNSSNRRYLFRRLGDKQIVRMLFDDIGPSIKSRNGGFVRIVKIIKERVDGADMARIEIILPEKKISNKKEDKKEVDKNNKK